MPSILVVEDHPVMRPTLRDLLQLEGYAVSTAVHGSDALARLEEESVDLVITDFMMPELDGLTLLQRLRADGRYADLPVLMFTAAANPEIRARVMAAGADDFLLRPITPQDFLAAVRRLIPG